MAQYHFRAFDRAGAEVTGQLSAADEAGAMEALGARGLTVFDLSTGSTAPEKPWYLREIGGTKAALSDAELAEFARSLGLMLRNGIPLLQSLSIVAETASTPKLRRLGRRLEEAQLAGQSLSQALADQSAEVPFEMRALVRAGEAANHLGETLEEAATAFGRRVSTRTKVIGALAYPVFLLMAAFVVLGIVLFLLTPTLYTTFASSGLEVGGMIAALETFRLWLARTWPIVVVVVAAGALALLVFRRALGQGLVRLLPPLRRLAGQRTHARVARTLRLLLIAGETLEAALALVVEMIPEGADREVLVEAHRALLAGQPAGPVFLDAPNVPRLFARLYDLGERTHTLPQLLAVTGDELQAEFGRSIDRLTGLITPVLTLVVGGVIGTLVFVLLSAVLEMSQIAL